MIAPRPSASGPAAPSAAPAKGTNPVTGAAEDWLASIGIPALTVELETRDSIEWQRNWAAVQETMNLFNE